MSRYAQMTQGVLVNLTDSPDAEDGCVVIDTLGMSPAPEIGQILNHARTGFIDDPVRFATMKAALGDAIDEKLQEAFNAGFNYDFGAATAAFEDGTTGPAGVQNIQTRDSIDRTNWLILESVANDMMAASQGSANLPTPIRAASNAEVTITASAGKTFCIALKSNGSAKLGYSWVLKKQVMQAPSIAALQAIDIESGWPA